MFEIEVKDMLEKATGLVFSPIFSLGPYPAGTYKTTPINGGHVKQSQVEVRLMGKNYYDLLLIRKKLIEQLDIKEKEFHPFGNIYYRSALAGGGELFNDSIQMWEIISLFIFTWRYIDGTK